MASRSRKTGRAKRLTQNELFALLMNEIRINKDEILTEMSLFKQDVKKDLRIMDETIALLRTEVHQNQTTLVRIVDDHDQRLTLLEAAR